MTTTRPPRPPRVKARPLGPRPRGSASGQLASRVPPPPRGHGGPPRPPRRAPAPPLRPPSAFERSIQIASLTVGIVLLGFVLNVAGLSQIQHLVSQQNLSNTFREQLSLGTAPVSEGDVDGHLLTDGDPVAVLDVPQLDVHEVVVEGTSSSATMLGPGHRRDTILPGQAGVSVIYGRAAAYGGPFLRLQELAPGSRFAITTGQGRRWFSVIGVRYAGDPTPPAVTADESRVVLVTARGPAFIPTDVVYVDARMSGGAAEKTGLRQTTYASLPSDATAMATDTSTVWALVFALQFLLIAELLASWLLPRVGRRKVWVVFAPILLLSGLFVGTQLDLLLPNLL